MRSQGGLLTPDYRPYALHDRIEANEENGWLVNDPQTVANMAKPS